MQVPDIITKPKAAYFMDISACKSAEAINDFFEIFDDTDISDVYRQSNLE